MAHREGLVVGRPGGTFRPARPLKPGEAAAVVRLARVGVPSTYATATQGAPGWGVFAFLLPWPDEPPGDAVL